MNYRLDDEILRERVRNLRGALEYINKLAYENKLLGCAIVSEEAIEADNKLVDNKGTKPE